MSEHEDDIQPVGSEDMKEIDYGLRLELIRHIFEMPDGTRAKLLAFLHLVEEFHAVDAELQIDEAGQVALKLFSRRNPRAVPRPAVENDVEPPR